jgi:hypothetical protein
MKKFSLLLICVAASVATFAAERIPGKIIYADKTLDVTLLIPTGLFGSGPNTEALQRRVRYLDARGKKKWLRPEDAREYRFDFQGQTFRMVSRQYTGSFFSTSDKIFLLQLIDGPLKMFEHRQTAQTGAGPNMPSQTTQTISYLLQRNEEPLMEPRTLGFKKQMAEYFADCPALVSLIQDKEFKRRDLDEIVLFYNQRCGGGTN